MLINRETWRSPGPARNSLILRIGALKSLPWERILSVYDKHRTVGHTIMAPTLFQAVANTLHWREVVCGQFGTARRLSDDTVIDVIATRRQLLSFASAASGNGLWKGC
jgi:hypothetical protein